MMLTKLSCVHLPLVFLVLFCLFSSILCVNPNRQNANGINVDFLGHSGQFTLWTANAAHFIQFKFLKLQELDVNGNVVAAVNTFANQDFTWTVVGQQTNSSFIGVQLSVPQLTVNPMGQAGPFNANFQITTELFVQPFNSTFAGEFISAKPGQLKWTLFISGWQFRSQANTLRFGLSLLSDIVANNTAYKILDHVPGTLNTFAIAFGAGNLIVPRVAQEDGKNVNITAAVIYEGGQLAVVWDFPAFMSNLTYDPIAATSDLALAASITSTSGALREITINGFIVIANIVMAMTLFIWLSMTE